jgi:hypothetical protein
MTKVNDIQVGPGKILVQMWMNKKLKTRIDGMDKIFVDEKQKKEAIIKAIQEEMGSTSLVKAEIINLGPKLDQEMKYEVGKFVYVFPSTFDAEFVIQEIGYYVYSERNILALLPAQKEESNILTPADHITLN